MKKVLLVFAMLFVLATMVLAQIMPGENLLANGMLQTSRTDTPPTCWSVEKEIQYLSYNTNGGPDDEPFIRFANLTGERTAGETCVRQNGLRLVKGETYRISAWVKTVDFQCSHANVIIGNNGWTKTVRLPVFPANQDWTYMEFEGPMVESSNNLFFCAIYACNFTGELDVADVKLEALSEKALAESQPSGLGQLVGSYILAPWEPLLCRIPADKREVSLKLFLPPRKSADGLDLLVTFEDCQKTIAQPLHQDVNTVKLPDGAKEGIVSFSIQDRESGDILLTNKYPYAVKEFPVVSAADHKRLNNLVTQVLNAPLAATNDTQEFHFSMVKDGWVFIAAQNIIGTDIKVVLDGKITAIDADTPRLENFREVSIGDHVLTITGAKNGGNILVNAIAEIFNYCPCVNSNVKENPPYDWDFQMRYGMPAITIQNGGIIPKEHLEWFHNQGYKWLANLNTSFLPADELLQRLQSCEGMNDPRYDGVTCDEQFFAQPSALADYTRGLKRYENPKDRIIYTWIVGKPCTAGLDQEFMAVSVNASHGRGKLIHEAYCRSQATEAEAKAYLDDVLNDTVAKFKEAYPNVISSMGMIFGNFNQMPILSLLHHPEVDYKYFLDMQLNRVANDPEFDGLGCVGYWGSYYADHELHRWSYMLLRHYAVEGKTAMLSDEYGFTYNPDFVKNGDFRGTFDGWTVEGNVSLDKCEGFANASQDRWGGNKGIGDTFAVLSKESDEVSTLTQTATGLTPGKMYLLQFSTFDADDAKAHRVDGRDFGIRATLDENADIQPALSWQHIDQRAEGRYAQNNGCARPNLHHIVFIAKAENITITLNNKLAKPGENLGVNFFAVTPYLAE